MNTIVLFRLLGSVTVAALAVSAVLLLSIALPAGRRWWRSFGWERAHLPVQAAWFVSLAAMSGSLYLSEVIGFLPCELCWFQRIAMFPLVAVLGVAALRRDETVWRVAIPLPLIGLAISVYHVALQFNPSIDIVSCDTANPCSTRYLFIFGFISIPTMAGAAFLLITALLTASALMESGADEEEGHEVRTQSEATTN